MSLDHCSDGTPVNAKIVVHVKVWNSTTLLKKNEERCGTFISTTSNLIQSDNECQFTKLANQKSRVTDISSDSVIQSDSDERAHLTNTEVKNQI